MNKLKNEDDAKNNAKSVQLIKPTPLSKLVHFKDTNELFEFMTRIAKSSNIKAETPEDAIAAYVKCSELGIGWANGLDHMNNINGRLGVDFHIITALVLRKGLNIHWDVTEDSVVLYDYVTKIGDKLIALSPEELTEDMVFVSPATSKETNDKYRAEGKTPVVRTPKVICEYTIGTQKIKLFDKRTTITFTRILDFGRHGNKVLTIVSSFSNTDALLAGVLFNKQGDWALDKPWFKYNDNQRYVRAFTLGARRCGDDVLLGMAETSELYDINHIDYTQTSEGVIEVTAETVKE